MDLSKALAEILEGSDGSRINIVASILKDGGVGTADDLKYFDWNSLKDIGGLSNMEVNKIMRYIQERPEKCIDNAVPEIFKDSIKIEFITDVLKREGVRLADDLKYFDEELLESLGGLEETEINKIMRFIEEEHPEMFKQHKQKKVKKYLLHDLLKLKNEAHILKQPSFIAKLFSFLRPVFRGTEV